MRYLNRSIKEIHEALIKGEVTPLQLVEEALDLIKKDDNNAFEYVCEKEAYEQIKELDKIDKNNLLWGIPYTIKDNYSTKDIPSCASSNILDGYIPLFSAEVCERLKQQGAILIGKTTLDELAMGGSGATGHLGKTFNPWDKTHQRMIGGSSCGSAASCASGIVPFSIGSDTGDSVRKPASYAGLVGFKPTWGRISRFGLFPFASSLDHVAYFSRNVFDSALLLNVLAGKDEKDSTSSSVKKDDYLSNLNTPIKGMKIAVIEEIINSVHDLDIKTRYNDLIAALKEQGAIISYVHLNEKLCKAVYPAYIVISSAEATSNSACLDGIKYGDKKDGENYEKILINTRTAGFSELIKRRFVIGSYALLKENRDEIFLRAQKCRRLIVNGINDILKDNDAICLPASPSIAPHFDDSRNKLSDEYLIADNYLAFANFGGQPSITLPLGLKDNMPFGVNITGRIFEESNVLKLASKIEEITGLKDLLVGE